MKSSFVASWFRRFFCFLLFCFTEKICFIVFYLFISSYNIDLRIKKKQNQEATNELLFHWICIKFGFYHVYKQDLDKNPFVQEWGTKQAVQIPITDRKLKRIKFIFQQLGKKLKHIIQIFLNHIILSMQTQLCYLLGVIVPVCCFHLLFRPFINHPVTHTFVGHVFHIYLSVICKIVDLAIEM